MTLRRLPLLLVAALVLAAPAAARRDAHVLAGEVGPGFTIEVTSGGKDVKTLKPGTYTFRIEDKSRVHDFHLIGPGVNRKTTVPFVGEQAWTVKLKRGTYRYQCDPHAALGMKGRFTVTG